MDINYILGLIEGEGCFFYKKYIREQKWKEKFYPCNQIQSKFQITMNIRDRKLVENIREKLKIGIVRIKKKRKIVEFTISNRKELLKLVKIIDSHGGFLGFKNKQYIEWKKNNGFDLC